MQDLLPSQIATPVKQLLIVHFSDDKNQFPTGTVFPRLKPWRYLKNIFYTVQNVNLANLEAGITHHIHSINTDILRSVVEHAILRLELITEQSKGTIE
ncbi:hypothetical protein TNIN_229561 [Trichonephila inaurata madagascariensis]|uniref:Uncharacterized protein n=1 Tax=Trichonephila inaurata madagascariensis TaxID=2747483 RepID=A0A8X6WUF7_9ARAC|nr:hypothetical protein TNIN_229561 [Trichonephila inaurata madagascariensis]